jgi:hypothetical protein
MAGWVERRAVEGHRRPLVVDIVAEGVLRSLQGLELESHMAAEEGILAEEARHMAAVVGDSHLVEEGIAVVGEHHMVVAEGSHLAVVGIVLVEVRRMAAEEDSRPVAEGILPVAGEHRMFVEEEEHRRVVEEEGHRIVGMEVAENLFNCQI